MSIYKPIHLAANPKALPTSPDARANPITLPKDGKFPMTSEEAVAYMQVRTGKRYLRTTNATFCNIYAYDYCFLRGVFMAHIWWLPAALRELQAGNPQQVIYAKTVYEVDANGLHDWMVRWGATFGWERAADFTELQQNVNMGAVGLITAAHANAAKAGHVSIVVPEGKKGTAKWVDGKVLAPLQCQAGAANWEYRDGANWWASPLYRAWGSWYCVPPAVSA